MKKTISFLVLTTVVLLAFIACDGTLHEIPVTPLPTNEPLPVPVTNADDDDLITGVYKGVFVNGDYSGDFNIAVTDTGTAALLNVRVNGKVETVTGVVSDDYYASEGYLELRFPFTLMDTDFEFRALLYDDGTMEVGVQLDEFRSDILAIIQKDRTTARVNTWTGLYSGSGTGFYISGKWNIVTVQNDVYAVFAGTKVEGLVSSTVSGEAEGEKNVTDISLDLILDEGTGTAAGSQAGSTMYGTWETSMDESTASGNWSVSKTM